MSNLPPYMRVPPVPNEWKHSIGAWQTGWIHGASGHTLSEQLCGYRSERAKAAYKAGFMAAKTA